MPAIIRLGDICSGHDGFPPRAAIEGSNTVLCNGKPIVCIGHKYDIHCNVSCHDGMLSTGSKSVFVEGNAVGRVGDKISCGSTAQNGSENVLCGE